MRTHFRRESSRIRALHPREIWRGVPSVCTSPAERGTVGPLWREAMLQLFFLACTLAALATTLLLGLCWFAVMQGASPLMVLP
ncbi:hypothetical protein PLCT1_00966 [Planctomycetaceae bacterium]|nr:hypothetical protein PLCT1_00966 [Planctomycetaceae bacterium]